MNDICVGQRAEGKTTLGLWLAFCNSRLVLMWDPRAMGAGERVHNPDEFEEAIDNACDNIRQRRVDGVLISYVPESGELDKEFADFCSVPFPPGFPRHKFSVVIDEAAQLQKPNWIDPNLDRVVRQAPRSILVIQTTHSLQDYHRASKDLMDDLYCFKMKGRSLDAAVDYMDGGEDMRAAIAALPPHHLLHYSFARHCGPEFEIWDDPTQWYVRIDSRAQEIQSSSEVGNAVPASPIEGDRDSDVSFPPRREKTMLSERWVN